MKPPLLYILSGTSYETQTMARDFRVMSKVFEINTCFLNRYSLRFREHLATFTRRGGYAAIVIRGGNDWSADFFLEIHKVIKESIILSRAPCLVVMPHDLQLEPEDSHKLHAKFSENKELFRSVMGANASAF